MVSLRRNSNGNFIARKPDLSGRANLRLFSTVTNGERMRHLWRGAMPICGLLPSNLIPETHSVRRKSLL
jgi:hypothetical protein